MFPQHAVQRVAAQTYYRWMMDEFYEDSPWDDEHEPSNETREEAERFADEVIHTLATQPHRMSDEKLERVETVLCALLDAGRPLTRAEGRALTGGPATMSSEDYDQAVRALLRNQWAKIEPIEQRPPGRPQRICLTHTGHVRAMVAAGLQDK